MMLITQSMYRCGDYIQDSLTQEQGIIDTISKLKKESEEEEDRIVYTIKDSEEIIIEEDIILKESRVLRHEKMTYFMNNADNYKEKAETLSKNKGYKLVKGFYFDPFWNKEVVHWWCTKKGIIHDSSIEAFSCGGIKDFYRNFNNEKHSLSFYERKKKELFSND